MAQLEHAHKAGGNPFGEATECRRQYRQDKKRTKKVEAEAFIGAKVLVEYDSPGGSSHKDHEGCVSQGQPVVHPNVANPTWCMQGTFQHSTGRSGGPSSSPTTRTPNLIKRISKRHGADATL